MINLEVKEAIFALNYQLLGEQENNNCVVAVDVEADGFLRGIEHHIYPQRFRNKLIARRVLIKYQTHLEAKSPILQPNKRRKL